MFKLIHSDTLLISSDKALELLVSCLESSSLNVRALGASALWALLHNYQKVFSIYFTDLYFIFIIPQEWNSLHFKPV